MEAARRAKAVVQVGSQQRSTPNFRQAVELVRYGHLGRVQKVEVGLPPGYENAMGDTTVAQTPKSLDYDFWCGPAPVLPYMRARHHRWWRGHRAYGGGVLMDWIGHHNDIAHWATEMDQRGPESVEAVGWTAAATEVYDTPHQYAIQCVYPGGIHWSISTGHTLGAKIIGDKGWVFVTRGKLDASQPRWLAKGFDPSDAAPRADVAPTYRSPQNVANAATSPPGVAAHVRNFLDGVKSRAACICPAEVGHRSVTPGHLAYVSHALGRKLRWNAEQQVILDDKEADSLLRTMEYRDGWKIED